MQNGDIDIAVSSTSSLSTLYKDYYLYDTPYLFLNKEEVYDVGFTGETATKMLEGVEKVGLKHMAMWENGFRNYTNNAHPIESPADCKGQKIRTMENPIHMKAWKEIGANPTPMAFSELFTAMQQGTVDGEENPIGIISSNRFYEVQKYISLTQHVYTPYVVVMNPDKYDTLTKEQQEIVDRAMKEATQFQLEQSAKDEEEGIKIMEDYGCEVNELTDEQKMEFQKIMEDADVFGVAKDAMENPEYFDGAGRIPGGRRTVKNEERTAVFKSLSGRDSVRGADVSYDDYHICSGYHAVCGAQFPVMVRGAGQILLYLADLHRSSLRM